MISFEKLVAERLVRGANVAITPECSALLEQLLRNIKEGDFCCPIERPEVLPEALWEEGREEGPLPTKPLVVQGNRLYTHRTWSLETLILRRIAALAHPVLPPAPLPELAACNAAQRAAIERAWGQNVSVFTGGPGTGKSYTAVQLIRWFVEAYGPSFKTIIAAPTGRAAAHLQSALPKGLSCTAATLHRLLQLQPGQQRLFAPKCLEADLVVVDEASMLDASLLLHLLNAISPKTRLLLLGDPNQLPPIEGTGFFPEIAKLFGSQLSQPVRTGGGFLLQFAQDILSCDADVALQNQNEAVQWLPWRPCLQTLSAQFSPVHHSNKPDPLALLAEQKRFVILSAFRSGPLGVDAINRALNEQLLGQKRSCWTARPILIVQNSESQQLYNGHMGVLLEGPDGKTAYFSAPEGVRAVPEAALPPYEWAFCLSVHKSQGSEFDEVLLLLGPGSERFGKEALYTAVTRAKKRVVLCTDEAAFRAALRGSRPKQSGFIERLRALRFSHQIPLGTEAF